jgi:hypothetical protein
MASIYCHVEKCGELYLHPPSPNFAFMVWHWNKHRDNFTFTLNTESVVVKS